MKQVFISSILIFNLQLLTLKVFSQNVGIGITIPDTKAILDLTSNSKGLLIPRLSTAQRTGISSPPIGLMVYDSTAQTFFYYDGSAWQNR